MYENSKGYDYSNFSFLGKWRFLISKILSYLEAGIFLKMYYFVLYYAFIGIKTAFFLDHPITEQHTAHSQRRLQQKINPVKNTSTTTPEL